ncbi:MAG TPA: hypothetical protein VNH40_12575 [Gaiellaceae bacterium]|nr:hypothetical protein [Gaiellaceae bacterium]
MSGSHTTTMPYPTSMGRVDQIDRELREALGWTGSQPNGETLWRAVRLETEEVLDRLWRDGELVGAEPSEAFFVRCDRSTMTDTDVEVGRLVLRIGVATVRARDFAPIRIDRKVGQPLRCSPIGE